jgi:hypothetical protein
MVATPPARATAGGRWPLRRLTSWLSPTRWASTGSQGLCRQGWLDGMDPEIAAELEWAEAGETVLNREMERAQALMQQRINEDPGALLGVEASDGDVRFLLRPEVVEAFRRIIPEQARHGVGGSVDDTFAFARDWGFDLARISVPVLLSSLRP